MMKVFEMSDLGQLKYFLGLEVTQYKDSLFVSQWKYAEDLLSKAGLLHCNPVGGPINLNEKLQMKDGSGDVDCTKYRRIVGSLLYLTHTRPDLMHAVSVVARFMQSPTKHQYGAVKRILRYVSGTTGYGLHYAKNDQFKLVGYSDSDWGGSPEDRRSTTRWVFSLGSGAVAWCSKNPVHHSRTKHIDTRYHYIRDLIKDKVISVVHCSTHDQLHGLAVKMGLYMDTLIGNSLITMYVKNGEISDSWQAFKSVSEADIISWNSIVHAHLQNEQFEQALALYVQMKVLGFEPDEFSFVAALAACGELAWCNTGRGVHFNLVKIGMTPNAFVGSALIGMYSKFTATTDAKRVFDTIEDKDLVTWNSLISEFV
ncbi:uncharacterized mitochondrial protein AtMg00810-like [Dioscorea cayenensis subsp. rotundata]|uniref:Uncharacterized mitochondrial protein AtMg00810-like n=1 Tax=Dioscorea cayennensis subsp. rotundata TaxID=55577 RepID=A0AB40CFJ0_DIOCR|nr:uncharacterized mitochondrial protein AtMg00810-like [Dioscorea cayenensis subsp. rotundata]